MGSFDGEGWAAALAKPGFERLLDGGVGLGDVVLEYT